MAIGVERARMLYRGYGRDDMGYCALVRNKGIMILWVVTRVIKRQLGGLLLIYFLLGGSSTQPTRSTGQRRTLRRFKLNFDR